MPRLIDRVSDALGRLAGWMYFAVGGMIVWEVAARYVFNAPTIWAEEMARFFQLWATYLAAATVLRHRGLIRITLVIDRLGERARRIAELFSLTVIAAFCLSAIWYGWTITADSLAVGRTSSTMLDVPSWMTEIAIPAGFSLLLLQCLAEIGRLLTGGAVPEAGHGEMHER